MSLPNQMTTHMLNPAKNWSATTDALDFSSRISSNVLYDMRAGQCAHLNSAGENEPGVQLLQMGLFMFQGKNDFDVNNERNDQWTPISPSGRVMSLVATGGFELETTEFDNTLVYTPNDHLIAPVGNTTGDEFISGVLSNAAVGTLYAAGQKARVGVVSRGAFTNVYGTPVVAFWPIYLPGLV